MSLRIPASSTVTASGSTIKGARSVEFIFSSDFDGTVNGVAYSGATDASQLIAAPAGDRLETFRYTVSAGSIRLIQLT